MLQKTFYKVLVEVNHCPAKVKHCLSDKRLTNIEKKILEAYLLIRNNKNGEATAVLKGLPPSELPFVEAQRMLLSGLALNNQSHFKEAEFSILKANQIFKEQGFHYFLFMGCFNLCFIYLNTRRLEKMKEMVLALEAIPVETDLQKIRILRCQFAYASETGDLNTAHKLLASLQELKKSMLESDIISQQLCEFMFYVKTENFSMCHHVLIEMKKFRKFQLSENFNFMKKLLDHLTLDAPIYLTGGGIRSVPVLSHQLLVIHALEEKNKAEAEKHWAKLADLSPELYLENFNYTGTKCLFSLCLNKHLVPEINIKSIIRNEDQSFLSSLINLLQNSPGPIPKSQIYEFLWGEPPIEKEDLKRLGRLISRIRSENGIEIISRKGTYFIERKEKHKKKTG